jgi:hypothetical protein
MISHDLNIANVVFEPPAMGEGDDFLSIIAHSANLKITSRSLTINQCSGGSILCGQDRLQRCILPDRRSTPTLKAGYYDGTRVSFFLHQFES